MARRAQIFKFNLLPAKSEAEIVIEAERDDSLIYAVLLVFFSLFAFVALSLANSFLILPRVGSMEEQLKNIQTEINTYQGVRAANGELFVKTETLAHILKRDLAAEEIFRVAREISSVDSNIGVIKYSREQSGVFVFDFLASDLSIVTKILSKAREVNGVSDVFIRDITVVGGNRVLISTQLSIATSDGK
jgi:hypothetical protein